MPGRDFQTPEDRLRRAVGNALRTTVRESEGLGSRFVIMHLPYSMEDLVSHLESLFEPWMNWDNWAKWEKGRRTWQIDHVVPQSSLPFDEFAHPNFLKCWDLSNLRPFESSRNLKKGSRK